MNYDEKQNAVKSSTSSVFESVVCLSSLGLEAGVPAAVARRGYLLTGSQVAPQLVKGFYRSESARNWANLSFREACVCREVYK
jgi:hypothetical protein